MNDLPVILTVEDDPLIAHLISHALANAGYRVSVARTAADGLRQSLAQPVALILLDISLPDGNGIDLARQLRRSKLQTPIIFLTAYEDDELVKASIDCGAHAFLVKPVSVNQLLPVVRTALAAFERQAAKESSLISALHCSRTISAAVGMLAERKRCALEDAFEMIRKGARKREMKVEILAGEIICGRIDPGDLF